MAGFNFTPIQIQSQPQTSLADMMNIARGAQAYQQAQQLNPLQIQQAQQALQLQNLQTQKAAQTLEPEVSLAKTQAEQAKLNLNDAQLANLQKQQANSSRNLIKLLDSPEPVTPARIKDHVVATMQNAGASDQAIIQAVQGLPTTGTDKQLRAYLAKHTLNSLTAEAELEKRFPTATLVAAGGQILPTQVGAEAFTGVKPGTQVGQPISITPTPGTATVGGLVGQYDASGKFVPFTIQPSGAPATTPIAPTAPKTEKMPGIVQIDPVRPGGQLNEREKARYDAGELDFKAASDNAKIAQDSSLAAQQIKRSLAAAAGSKSGQVVRDVGQAFFGNPELDTLVKNLAEQQVRQAKLMGLSSVSAENDLKAANGSDKITAEALAHIVERADAMNMAATKYAQAQSAMQKKYGKDSTYINNDNFKRTWAENYDPIAFIIQNTNRQNIPQKDKDTIIDYYTHGMSEKDLKDLAEKMKNLKRLERGDF